MAGGAADCSLSAPRVGGFGWVELAGVGSLGMAPRYFETYPYLTLHIWKGC